VTDGHNPAAFLSRMDALARLGFLLVFDEKVFVPPWMEQSFRKINPHHFDKYHRRMLRRRVLLPPGAGTPHHLSSNEKGSPIPADRGWAFTPSSNGAFNDQ
jgi:hypothetical protein